MDTPLMKIGEVAARLNASGSFVRGLISSGRLKHHRLGKAGLRVSEEQLQEYLRGTEKGGEPRQKPAAPKQRVRLNHLA